LIGGRDYAILWFRHIGGILQHKEEESVMKIKVNGKEQMFDQSSVSVTELLELCQVSQPDMVSVQWNGEFVNRGDYPTARVQDADEVDFLYFMGGGN
jgi:sulfur carrier protein